MRPFDDTAAMLAALRAEGYRLAVLTNGDEDLFAVSQAMLGDPFDLVISAERIRGYKPAPWHFRAFARLARVRPDDWVHVGSSAYHDVAPAVALGVRHVWLDRHEATRDDEAPVAPSPATLRVRGGAEVPDAVACLFAHPLHEGLPAAACC